MIESIHPETRAISATQPQRNSDPVTTLTSAGMSAPVRANGRDATKEPAAHAAA